MIDDPVVLGEPRSKSKCTATARRRFALPLGAGLALLVGAGAGYAWRSTRASNEVTSDATPVHFDFNLGSPSTTGATIIISPDGRRIVVSSRDRNLRIALHFYNVDDDVDTVLAALARHRDLLA